MKPFSSDDLVRMRATADSSMFDSCDLLDYQTVGTNDYGMPVEQYVQIGISVCGFDPTASQEVMEDAEVVVTDATARLPLETPVDSLDRVRITHRYGEALSAPVTYDLIGAPRRGPSAIVLLLRLVTDGSDE